MTAATLPIPSPESGLSAYLNQIKRFPLLEPDQEYRLAKRFHDEDDVTAAHELVTSHLRLVAKIAMGYRRYGLPMADVIAEGNLGLMKAVKKFEPEKGFRLSTYAMWWVKASINEYILNSWSLVKIGTVSTQKRIFYNLRKMKAQLGSYEDGGGLTDEHATQIADTLQVKKSDVHAMNARLQSRDRSLNAPIGEDGDAERVDLLPDTGPNQEEMLEASQTRDRSRILVHTALDVLNERERHIITQRRLIEEPVTLESLGEDYGLSRERVRQIEARALQKLEARIRDLVKEEKRGVHAALIGHAASLPAPDQAPGRRAA
ncbi:MAG: RNA polymerase sigma 70 [Rhodospirillaceae bacterium BRH_c57]|nr:MAG: RNA polymerase sigma 70 [Rhodospirillaceae bacterium BRH_c57]